MSETEIDRIRRDIDVIREAAGLGLPFGWEDVWLSLAAIPCGLVLSAVGAWGPLNSARLAAIPTLGILVAAAGLRFRYRRSSGRSPVRRKEYDLGLVAALLYALIAGGFLAWARHLGQPMQVTGGMALAMTGGLCAMLGATASGRRSYFVAAAILIAFGLVIPVSTPRQVIIAAGAGLAATGMGAAAIQAIQLKSFGGGAHEQPAAH
jgi:hypothetical protein